MEFVEHYPYQEDVYQELSEVYKKGTYMVVGSPSRIATIIDLQKNEDDKLIKVSFFVNN